MKLADFIKTARAIYDLDFATARTSGLFPDQGSWIAHRRDPIRWLIRADDETRERFWAVITQKPIGR